jgi:uncharacterized protein (DUF1778 family)
MPTISTTRSAKKTKRLHQRISPEAKSIIEKAASLRGVTVNDFVTSSAYEAAMQTIKEHEFIQLSQKETERFVKTFFSPPVPTNALKKLMRRKD